MSEKEYIVTLHRNVDYQTFDAEMVANTGAGAIPNRSAPIANPRPGSKRNTHYMLTEQEAEMLRNDPRVFGVEIPPEKREDLELGLRATQTGNFTKTSDNIGDFINWGLRRCNESTNPYTENSVEGGYDYTLDGTGVDIVVHDTGIQADHPEWEDANGTSRLQEIDWYTASGLPGTLPDGFYTDYHGHGTHVGSTIAGKTYGWAKNAKIYALKVDGLEGPTDPNGGIPISDCFDVVKEWHNNKPIDPVTGVKRPTIVNMSWGYSSFWTSLSAIQYRGTTYTGTDIDEISELTSKGLIPVFDGSRYKTNVRIASVDADVQEMIDAGIHVVIAAGNNYHKIDIEGGEDYDNNLTGTYIIFPTNVYYNRGSSPYDEEAHNVGNIDSAVHAGGLEQKAESSETGPGVNVFAPGTNIMAAASNVNVFNGDGEYPPNTDFKISNISGTSMAAPQVAGVLALYAQVNPGATPAQGLAFINDNASSDKLFSTGLDNDYDNYRSLAGGNNRFLFNKFNSGIQLSIGNS